MEFDVKIDNYFEKTTKKTKRIGTNSSSKPCYICNATGNTFKYVLPKKGTKYICKDCEGLIPLKMRKSLHLYDEQDLKNFTDWKYTNSSLYPVERYKDTKDYYKRCTAGGVIVNSPVIKYLDDSAYFTSCGLIIDNCAFDFRETYNPTIRFIPTRKDTNGLYGTTILSFELHYINQRNVTFNYQLPDSYYEAALKLQNDINNIWIGHPVTIVNYFNNNLRLFELKNDKKNKENVIWRYSWLMMKGLEDLTQYCSETDKQVSSRCINMLKETYMPILNLSFDEYTTIRQNRKNEISYEAELFRRRFRTEQQKKKDAEELYNESVRKCDYYINETKIAKEAAEKAESLQREYEELKKEAKFTYWDAEEEKLESEEFFNKAAEELKEANRLHNEAQKLKDEADAKKKAAEQERNKSKSRKYTVGEYYDALALFMLRDKQYTLSDLKSQRNKLIKAFHTDSGEDDTQYAQRINVAFDILKNEL